MGDVTVYGVSQMSKPGSTESIRQIAMAFGISADRLRAILDAVGDATADEVRKALTQRPQIVESFAAVAETALGYRAALERIADAKPYRLTHREIASIARLALTDDARIEEGNA